MQILKNLIQFFQIADCNCGGRAVVKCKTWKNKTVYLCSDCLRSFRFREKDFFKSIMPFGRYK